MAVDWSAGQGMLQAGGRALEYRSAGPAPGSEAQTIVLLHEGLGCAALWRDFPHRLAEATGMGVLAYSRAGYGQSDAAPLPWPLDYMTREAVGVLPAVLDAAGVTRAVLMGHSDGATIAAIHAGQVQDPRVRGLVLMAPHFFTEEMGLAEIERAREAYEATDLRARMQTYHRDPDNAFRGWNDSWLAPGFRDWNVGDVIDTWRVPALAIQGRDDQYGTLAQIDEITRRADVPVEVMILEDCRHAPHQDQPQQVLDGVAEFCTRLDWLDVADPEQKLPETA